ncbi:hypothetical protein BDY24DRAFT_395753 [Mrakia frigida]|uniref:NAPDH-dependent diflavin reductase n=1 Tax=Mrakia frigida TaxID=29902 RepID=UPI003FCC1BDA
MLPDSASGESSSEEADLPPSAPLIIYASETGTSQDLACSIHRHLLLHSLFPPSSSPPAPPPLPISIQAFDHLTLPSLTSTPLIFVVSTTGNGEPPRHLRPLWNMLMRKDLPEDILDEVRFTTLGVGDSGYERFNWAGKILRRRLLGLGASEFMEGQEEWWADERAGGGLEVTLQPFLSALTAHLLPYYYPSSSSSPPPPPPLPSTHLFPPTSKLTLLPPSPLNGLDLESSHREGGPILKRGLSKELLMEIDDKDSTSSATKSGLATPPFGSGTRTPAGGEEGWLKGTLVKFERMTEEGWNQDVRFVEIKTQEGLIYSPGSILQLLPSNSPASLARFLALQPHLPPPTQRLLFTPSSSFSPSSTPHHSHHPNPASRTQAEPHQNLPLTLLELLRDHLDLSAVPRRSFFQWMRCFTTDEREIERLDEFLHLEQGGDDLYEYVSAPRRTLLEVLADFRGVKIPLEYLPEVLGRIRRREFSIAGSSIAHPGSIQLCIAMVSYKTAMLKAPRTGLCSTWLSGLEIGASIPIHVTPGTLTLPSSPSTPLILVGPGTGVAPLRACVEHRIFEGATDTTLYFGCRSLSKDFLFREDWERIGKEQEGRFALRVAASRDQEDKIYVQHLIKEDSKSVYEKIVTRKGHVFISGSSNAMPRAVKAALSFCLISEGGMTEGEAKAYLEGMEVEGRLSEECWS